MPIGIDLKERWTGNNSLGLVSYNLLGDSSNWLEKFTYVLFYLFVQQGLNQAFLLIVVMFSVISRNALQGQANLKYCFKSVYMACFFYIFLLYY